MANREQRQSLIHLN